eukprot:TRINITY_DN6335_c0_g1_i1.p1 TRINITY_DN6335_c0_g1~~TRINITY_DN6335_c0_g1_i1.p1  ORF type:complete len:77 (+),score=5.15 TRINITY_DN6335_c0_g1_i1:377-607(+)
MCAQAKLPASCQNSKSDLYCVPWGCGFCTTLWIDNTGKQICRHESISHQCSDISSVNLGSANHFLGLPWNLGCVGL